MLTTSREAGVLLHPTSLPGPYGIGDLGPEAIKFLDWVRDAGFTMWQVLPLSPTGYGDSPYQCFSAFAGNTLLISPELLVEEGLLTADAIKPPKFPAACVDYGWVIHWKKEILRAAYANYSARKFPSIAKGLAKFRASATTKTWLEDFALFIALKEAHGGQPWNTWEKPIRSFEKKAVAAARKQYAAEIEYQIFLQYIFARQWARVRAAAAERGLRIIGDMPIYVAYDSADTWANQGLFMLKANGNPTHVAGVPPDYFSATGQLWGNPLYRWKQMHARGYKWWIGRMKAMLELVDIVRLDHFRGFEAFWQVPFGEPTAVNGKWVKGPGAPLFAAIKRALKDLPIIAENLGVITPPVEKLREDFGMPGMKVLQFAWGTVGKKELVPDPDNVFAPHKAEVNSVVYTGTHDNPTTVQWWNEFAGEGEKALFKAYLGSDGTAPHRDLTRAAFATVANIVLVPMQDLLGVGAEGRMNFPGRESGNWGWRMDRKAASKALAKEIRASLLVYGRCANQAGIAQALVAKQSATERARKP